MTVEIPVSGGRIALVDDEDEPLVRQCRWIALKSPSINTDIWYARSTARLGGGERKLLMHTLITGWPMVDHVNGDGLDNRRSNLRPSTHSQNMANRRKYRAGTSQYKGVSLWQGKRWIAHCAGKHLGLFDSELNAAIAYDMAARAKWGEYAALNFPGPGERGALAA